MIAMLIVPVGIYAIVLFLLWGFLQMMFWLSDVVWNAVDDSSKNLKTFRYNPLNYG